MHRGEFLFRCSTLLRKDLFALFLPFRRQAFAPELPIPSLQIYFILSKTQLFVNFLIKKHENLLIFHDFLVILINFYIFPYILHRTSVYQLLCFRPQYQ